MTPQPTLAEISRMDFRTSRSGETATASLLRALGLQYRYQPAQLAIAKSLGLATQPAPIDNHDGKTIRGETLFGQAGPELWLTMILEHAGRTELPRKDLQELVAAHWARGASLLWDGLRSEDDPLVAFASQVVKAK